MYFMGLLLVLYRGFFLFSGIRGRGKVGMLSLKGGLYVWIILAIKPFINKSRIRHHIFTVEMNDWQMHQFIKIVAICQFTALIPIFVNF